ncbi:hypothetical protein Thpro_021495 [Acidihalobacter prosperus]|uniref:Uncharacterized protein n=1 Tax=Acidihalobacter prosperus TaxID=160660 RepID=A0A1A6C3M7_9GAMM|nr:hypothetical protein Thpro_021495 [Acidihalobacter prosperus]
MAVFRAQPAGPGPVSRFAVLPLARVGGHAARAAPGEPRKVAPATARDPIV